ncbi:hypothetical protein ABZ234_30605 [Nocardiopsis sp. NPDC006198]|uniref:hypothetical protein n=1 Tax=Nocardiopsis sp. NPDC006198 TaxID=3154472 RepID=UPI0033BF9E95
MGRPQAVCAAAVVLLAQAGMALPLIASPDLDLGLFGREGAVETMGALLWPC